MKKLVSILLVLLTSTLLMAANPIKECKINGISLHGRVKIVKHAADIKVRIVKNFADLRVKKVKFSPDKCGEWQFVDALADFTIQIVEHGEDISIKYVDFDPGVELDAI